MADHIPFVSGDEGCKLVLNKYYDSKIARLTLERADKFSPLLIPPLEKWLDPGVDGMDDLNSRRSESDKRNSWFDLMRGFPNFDRIGTPSYQAKPDSREVYAFVKALLDRCASFKPAWITVPQIPVSKDSSRNKINRKLAEATGKWKSNSGFSGRLILPIVFTHQSQISGKTKRNPKIQLAERCYHDAQADGYWAVDKSLVDDNGSPTLRNKRFPGVIGLHEELNDRISSRIRIAGPYWGLNLVLWAKGLVDYPAIGIGSGYQFFLSGGHAKQPSARLAIPSLRRRVGVGIPLRNWLDSAIARLAPSHPAHLELSLIRKNYTLLSQQDRAREQVAGFYKKWFDVIAAVPEGGRSMAMFQDLSAAYALGKSLPDIPGEKTARRPEAVAEPLMLICL